MKRTLTIDSAGRMVLPKEFRKRFGLHSGAKLELRLSTEGMILAPSETHPSMTKEGCLYVHEGEPEGTFSGMTDRARRERDRQVWGGPL